MTAPHLTVEQVATLLGVDRKKVTAWIASGELVAVNTTLSRNAAKPRWRIPLENLNQFQLRRQSQPVMAPKRRRVMAVKQYL
jgi:excisionase family DNA binding protein